MTVEVRASRGTAGVSPQNVEEAQYVDGYKLLNRNDLPITLRTDATSQVVVSFTDPKTNVLVASVILHGNSRLNLTVATAPQFDLNTAAYVINIDDVSGRSEIMVMEPARTTALINITSPFTTTQITQPGRYLIEASNAQTRVTTRTGSALIKAVQRSEVLLAAGQSTTINETTERLTVSEDYALLLTNPYFEEDLSVGWVYYNKPDAGEPVGDIFKAVYAGRTVAIIDRASLRFPNRQLSHGEDGLVQKVSLDVSQYSALEIRATFLVEEQSLSRCGDRGSECPIMLHLKFIDEAGTVQEFRQGFYAFDDPTTPFPERCDSCRFSHDQINLGSWFTYESENLVTVFSESRPMTITDLTVYTSGHAYKVYISEINIIGTK